MRENAGLLQRSKYRESLVRKKEQEDLKNQLEQKRRTNNAATRIQAITRGFLQRPKYQKALVRKKEEETLFRKKEEEALVHRKEVEVLKSQLMKMKDKLRNANDRRKREVKDVRSKSEQEIEAYGEWLEDKLRAEYEKHGESIQQQKLIDDSGKIIEYLCKKNLKLRQQYETLVEENARLTNLLRSPKIRRRNIPPRRRSLPLRLDSLVQSDRTQRDRGTDENPGRGHSLECQPDLPHGETTTNDSPANHSQRRYVPPRRLSLPLRLNSQSPAKHSQRHHAPPRRRSLPLRLNSLVRSDRSQRNRDTDQRRDRGHSLECQPDFPNGETTTNDSPEKHSRRRYAPRRRRSLPLRLNSLVQSDRSQRDRDTDQSPGRGHSLERNGPLCQPGLPNGETPTNDSPKKHSQRLEVPPRTRSLPLSLNSPEKSDRSQRDRETDPGQSRGHSLERNGPLCQPGLPTGEPGKSDRASPSRGRNPPIKSPRSGKIRRLRVQQSPLVREQRRSRKAKEARAISNGALTRLESFKAYRAAQFKALGEMGLKPKDRS